MTADTDHPSFMQLDAVRVGAEVDSTVSAHVAGCPKCNGYVHSTQQAESVPQWALQLPDKDVRSVSQRRRSRAWWTAGLAGAALAASLVGMVSLRTKAPPLDAPYVAVKGAPTVGVYIRHEKRVALWNGLRPLAPGDALRLKIEPADQTHVQVFTRQAPPHRNKLRELYSAALPPHRSTLLPKAWEVDEKPEDEILIVVLSDSRLSSSYVASLLRDAQGASGVWIRSLHIPKHTRIGQP